MSGPRKKRATAAGPGAPTRRVQERPGPQTAEYFERDRKAFGRTFRFRTSTMVIQRQLGSTVWDMDGNAYLDLSAGGAVANTGYCHPAIVEAATRELLSFTHGLTPLFPNPPAIELAERLKGVTPGGFEKAVWMGNSGSDAAETIYDFLPAATR